MPSLTKTSIQILGCGKVPYPEGGRFVQDLRSTNARSRLCAIRDHLFKASSVAGNATTAQDVYDGQHVTDTTKLSPRQAKTLQDELAVTRGMKTLPISIESLVDCKIVLGRWLRPSEMSAVFGANVSLVSKFYDLEARGKDGKVVISEKDDRVTSALGPGGATLNKMTLDADCIYMSLDMIKHKATLSVFARSVKALDTAARLLDLQQKNYRSDPKLGFGPADGPMGFRVVPNKSAPRTVTHQELFKVLNKHP